MVTQAEYVKKKITNFEKIFSLPFIPTIALCNSSLEAVMKIEPS